MLEESLWPGLNISSFAPTVQNNRGVLQEAFRIEEVGLARPGVYLSDGQVNLAILKSNDN